MANYYTTVSLMGGHNQKIDALNKKLTLYRDMLVTSDESKATFVNIVKDLVSDLNKQYPRCKQWNVQHHPCSNMMLIQASPEVTASIIFHELLRAI